MMAATSIYYFLHMLVFVHSGVKCRRVMSRQLKLRGSVIDIPIASDGT